jgi:hypothetical protein
MEKGMRTPLEESLLLLALFAITLIDPRAIGFRLLDCTDTFFATS